MEEKISLYRPPLPSTDFEEDASLCGNSLIFVYYKKGIICYSGIEFQRIVATRTRAESLCRVWHIDGLYDNLVEVKDSSWIKELTIDMEENNYKYNDLHHFMIYLDSAGCFEIVAEKWNILEEKQGRYYIA